MKRSGIPVAHRVVDDEEESSEGVAAALITERDVCDAQWSVREESRTLGTTAGEDI